MEYWSYGFKGRKHYFAFVIHYSNTPTFRMNKWKFLYDELRGFAPIGVLEQWGLLSVLVTLILAQEHGAGKRHAKKAFYI